LQACEPLSSDLNLFEANVYQTQNTFCPGMFKMAGPTINVLTTNFLWSFFFSVKDETG
jgi:hypothetical protein